MGSSNTEQTLCNDYPTNDGNDDVHAAASATTPEGASYSCNYKLPTLSESCMDLSTRNLERALSIRRQIDALQRRLTSLVSSVGWGVGAVTSPRRRAGRRKMPAAARAKIAAAARARWARFRAGKGKGAKKGGRRRGGITSAGRKRLSQLMKARWAARRKAAAKRK
jgi:hypothetical protein